MPAVRTIREANYVISYIRRKCWHYLYQHFCTAPFTRHWNECLAKAAQAARGGCEQYRGSRRTSAAKALSRSLRPAVTHDRAGRWWPFWLCPDLCGLQICSSHVSELVVLTTAAPHVGLAGMSRFGLTVILLICVRAAAVAPEIRDAQLGVGSRRLRKLIIQYSKQHSHHRLARKGWSNRPGAVALSQADQKFSSFSSKLMRKAHLANGLILLGMLGFSGVLFNMLNSRFQHSTRHLMLNSGSLLCTVLAFMAMKKMWKLSTRHHDLMGGLFSAMRFLALFALLPWLGFSRRRARGVPGKLGSC